MKTLTLILLTLILSLNIQAQKTDTLTQKQIDSIARIELAKYIQRCDTLNRGWIIEYTDPDGIVRRKAGEVIRCGYGSYFAIGFFIPGLYWEHYFIYTYNKGELIEVKHVSNIIDPKKF